MDLGLGLRRPRPAGADKMSKDVIGIDVSISASMPIVVAMANPGN